MSLCRWFLRYGYFILRVFLTICICSLFHFLLSVTSTSKNMLEKLCIIIIKITQISNKFLITIIVTKSTYVYFSQILSCLIPSCHVCVIIQNLDDNMKLILQKIYVWQWWFTRHVKGTGILQGPSFSCTGFLTARLLHKMHAI